MATTWEMKGGATNGSLDHNMPNLVNYQSKVSAPKNPKLIREIKKPRKLTPSDFMREMSMDTKQKLANTHEMHLPKIIELLDMGETSLQKNTQLVVDEPMFQPFPSEIYFQKFEPFNSYEVPLLLRNNDKVPRLVKVTQTDTPYFKIVTSGDAHQKVGPGLPVIYRIQFLPEENKDYIHEVIVTTEREKFIVPIKCIGSRAILDFPDEINFSMNPVKYCNSKVLLIRNIGNKDAKFSLKADSPFSVSPEHGILAVGDNMQVTINFQPRKCGDYKQELSIQYDTGDLIYVQLYGAAQDINVRLDKNSIHIEDTYITMNNQRTLTIHNRSDVIVHYDWKKFATSEEEDQQKLREIASLNRDEENVKSKLMLSNGAGGGATRNETADYMALLSRNFLNKVKNAQNKPYHFEDAVFFIQPIEGDIWPNSSIDVSIVFKPDYAQAYNKTAFCEITGRESRLALRLFGNGVGPKIQLSIENLDVGSIFIGSTHVYEVVISNKGFIDAIFSINIPNTQFGKCFSFEPNEGLISPNGYQAVSVQFKSDKLGDFNETFEITIDGKPEKYKLVIQGSVIPPTFTFDIPKLKYGLVSYGFKYSQLCYLTNTSLVPMNFSLRVASDSDEEMRVVDDEKLLKSRKAINNSNGDFSFKEFSIVPSTGLIPPQSEIKLLIEFVPHFIKKYETHLIVDIDDVATDLYKLPITARSIVPAINVLTSTIDMGRCFIYHSYEKIVKLTNETTLKARYYLLPSKSHDPFNFTSNYSEGVIEPNSTKEIPVYAEALQLGDIEGDLLIKINGSVDQPLRCHFTCLSQGPVVQIYPKDIDWGFTSVLHDSVREVVMANESLIEAKFSTSMSKKNSPWRVEPSSGVILPGSEITVKVICHLIDKTKYDDTIVVELVHATAQRIAVKAQGCGSSIYTEPHIGSLLDFGTFFSGGLVRRVFKLTNKSSRHQSLSFQPEGKTNSLNKKEMLKEKAKNLPPPTFQIVPCRLELYPNETKEISMEAYVEKPQLVEEKFECQSIIGKTSGKDQIMKFKIKCEFIEPLISFSTRDLVFRCEHDGNDLPGAQTKYLTISNISSLDLNARLSTSHHFRILDRETGDLNDQLVVNIKTGSSLHLGIVFETSFKSDSHNEVINGTLKIDYIEHQQSDHIKLTGHIYFPNVHLEKTLIDFGCILNETELVQVINMTNPSPLIVDYKWKFLVEADNVVSILQELDALEYQRNVENLKLEPVDDESSSMLRQRTKLEELVVKQPNGLIELPGIEEIFDINPLFGKLYPGETQKLTVTFHGHKEIRAYVRAICEVKKGPEYELMIKGEASILDYELSSRYIDLGCVNFDEIAEAGLTIKNTGRVTIKYNMIGLNYETNITELEPEKPLMCPSEGSIEAGKVEVITIKYLPGVPRRFSKKLRVQISHFSPEEITIEGEASFADIMLDLPRLESDSYKNIRKEARNAILAKNEPIDLELINLSPEVLLQVEIDRLAIENRVKEVIKASAESQREAAKKTSEFMTHTVDPIDLPNSASQRSATSIRTNNSFKKKIKVTLPDYILDFGHVILGTVKTHVIRAANLGKIMASFEIERQNFSKTGFLIDLERVKNLPNEESVEFVVTFDPRGANLGLGPIEHVIPISIVNGPTVNLRLKANVTMPDLQLSNDIIDFADVKCGECRIVTVQMFNHKEVRCDWSAAYLPKKDDKFTPMHLKRKKKMESENGVNKPRIFEILPPSGILMPGQKVNIQIKFMPTEEKFYEERLTVRMAQSSQRLMILCKGKGLEPRIELSKNSLEFDPILPYSPGDEQEIKITNPCSFPIEVYNLECDKNYLEEEKILRIIRGYDEYNTILLPPRPVGEKLPIELIEYYDEQVKKLEEEEKRIKEANALADVLNSAGGDTSENNRPLASAGTEMTHKLKSEDLNQQSTAVGQQINKPTNSATLGSAVVGDLDKNPVFDSIARYLGIDLSQEGRAARNRRGVAIIVHGPPLCGKSRAAVSVARHYECALLTIDSIIIDAMATSTSQAATRARQLCAEAAAKHAEEVRAQEAIDQAKNAANLLTAGTQSNMVGPSASTVPGQQQLSVEALAQHSISHGGVGVGSKKTSVAGDSHSNVKPGKKNKQDTTNTEQTSTHPSTPPPLLAPIARKLSISTHLFVNNNQNEQKQDDGYMSCVLPEEVIVELLSERFQLSDCQRGIVIDGLDTLFAQNYLLAATAILKAFNNRRFIYCITIKSDFQKYKEQLNKLQEEKIKAQKEKELAEQQYIEEMDEETYFSLPIEKRKEIDDRLQEAKKLRLKREAEEKAAEKERLERELAEQQARLEEEKKKKKKTTSGMASSMGGKEDKKQAAQPGANVPNGKGGKEGVKDVKGDKSSLAVSNAGDRPHTKNDPNEDLSEKNKKLKGAHDNLHDPHQPPVEPVQPKVIDPEEEKRKEAEKLLQQRFKTFELHYKDISNLMDVWDRATGSIFRQMSPSEKSEHEEHLNRKNKKDLKGKDKDKKDKEDAKKLKAAAAAAVVVEQEQKVPEPHEGDNAEESTAIQDASSDEKKQGSSMQAAEDGIGIPHLILEDINKSDLDDIHKHPRLPSLLEVLDGMGMGPKGPPVPPPAIFAVVPYPAFRKAPLGSEFSHYVFVTQNESDPNLLPDEKSKEAGLDMTGGDGAGGEKTPDSAPSKGGSRQRASKAGQAASGGGTTSRSESAAKKTNPNSEKRKDKKVSSPNRGPSSLSANRGNEDAAASGQDGTGESASFKLQRFRWIIPPNSEIVLRIRFTSEEVGQYDQTLNFEIVGTRRRYQLHCRGVCTFPSISRDPRIVFPNKKKSREPNEIVSKKFILLEETFDFGPLLYGNNRERCREGKFPDYVETLTIQNISPLDVEAYFCFLDENPGQGNAADKSEQCFFVEPGELTLKANETKTIKIYALPKENKQYLDTLVCCIKENPEPITFKVSCIGQKPELALDKNYFNFKQVLLHRKDSKDIKVSNNTLIPVQWRLEGVDLLGEEFVCNQTNGVIEPLSSFNLTLHFRALRPLVIAPKDKRNLKLLVSSVNSFLGFMENHTISVTAEAYDVAIEINLPKGNDGGLEFGSVRTNSEAKQVCNLRNKGKYPIKFNFLTEPINDAGKLLLKYLSISPSSGELLSAHDRGAQTLPVNVVIKSDKELHVKDLPVVKCQIIEPSVGGAEGSVIANIPIKISIKVLQSKFAIVPNTEINFGPMNVGTKRSEKINVDNKGEFDFKITISKHNQEANKSNTKDQNQPRIQVGIFTITPGSCIIVGGGHQQFIVECAPEAPGKYEEEFQIDITENPHPIIYKLSCEAAFPALTFSPEIFEEHTLIPNVLSLNPRMMGIGIYAEEENKFIFNNVIVGRTAKARFKIMNTNKMPIDVSMALKALAKGGKNIPGGGSGGGVTGGTLGSKEEITFELEPQRAQIMAHSYIYAVVSFTPSSMTSYSTNFEAMLENVPNSLKNKTIQFEITGEGNLPRFSIIKPALKNKRGQALMLFKRCIVNHSDSQLLTLSNDGTLATKVNFFLSDPESAFRIRPSQPDQQGIVLSSSSEQSLQNISSVIIQPGTQATFLVTCLPRNVQPYQASLHLTVTDNQFEDTVVQMIGEGYMEDVTLENLCHGVNPQDLSSDWNNLDEFHDSSHNRNDFVNDEDLMALKCNSISFGDIYINEKKQVLFTMKNQSKSDVYRFEWPMSGGTVSSHHGSQVASTSTLANLNNNNDASRLLANNWPVQFSPRVGHLHAGCAKDITVTFKSGEARQFRKELIQCLLTKITFEQNVNDVKDWDDKITTIKWVNELITVNNATNASGNSNDNARVNDDNGSNGQLTTQQSNKQIIKKKVVETEPEPKHIKLDDSVQPIELFVSANCDYCKYRCRTNAVRFRDTLMFQTRVYEVSVINRGRVGFDYNWKAIMEDPRRPFTPQIIPDSPTPEQSPSPERNTRGGKKSQNNDTSQSPVRRGNQGKDSVSSMSNKEGGKKDGKSNQGKKGGKDKDLEDTIKSNKSQSSRKTKDSKDKNGGDSNEDTINSKLDATFKLSQNDDLLATQRNLDEFRPDSQAQMRAESSLSHHPPSTISETGYIPFSVEPPFGRIEANKTQTFKVKFAPLNINDYQAKLICQIPNLPDEDGKPNHGPMIMVKGRGLLPYCHFELEESNYVSGGRRNPEMPGPDGAAPGLGLDPMTKVIEFDSVGLNIKVVKRFEIINPTNVDYDFEWIKEEQNDARRHDQFTCMNTRGHLPSGRKTQIEFEFEASEFGVQETFWRFNIPRFDLSVPFLLVGRSTEPKIVFDKSHVSFKPLLKGRTGHETVHLLNQESKEIAFEIDQTTCYSEGRAEVVLVEPSSGLLPPMSKFPIQLSFTPREMRQSVFNLKCKLGNSNRPLNLNVKGEGYVMQTSLYCEDPQTGQRVEFSDSTINEIHMGQVEKNEVCYRNMYIVNNGKHRVNYEWLLTSQSKEALECFYIEPPTVSNMESIEPGDKKHCLLKYVAKLERSTIANLILKVENGSVYHIHLDGIAVRPDLQVTPVGGINFGPTFVYKAGMKVKTSELTLTNRGPKDLNVACLTEQSAQSPFQHDFRQVILASGSSVTFNCSFIPKEQKTYSEKFVFELNGLTRREITLSGQGTPMRLELLDSKQRVFDLGTLQCGIASNGKTQQPAIQQNKKLQLINRSLIDLNFNLLFEPKSESLVKEKQTLTISPLQNIYLKPNQVIDLSLRFAPKTRVPKFVEELNMECNGVTMPLCSIQGACHGYNIWLESNALPFGAVVQKSSVIKRITMHNDGDIGASFNWDLNSMRPDFSVHPAHGYISPGMEVTFNFTFAPVDINPDIRKPNVKCYVEGLASPLLLTLSGSCIGVTPQKETHHFETAVRQKDSKTLSLANRTNATWELRPVIEGEYFSGSESLIVEPQSTGQYEIVYSPMTMTSSQDGKKHTGSVFFPLPDGTALYYNLVGSSNPPKPIAKRTHEVPCKTQFTELLMVENWLKKPQRFKVIFEITRPERPDPSTTIKGHDYIDLPGNAKKEYRLGFFAHKEGVTLLRVIFKNEQTGEFCYYELGFKATRGSTSMGTIDLVTQVRVPVSHSIRLDNPLAQTVTFNASCTNGMEVLIPTVLAITGKGQGDFNFEFLPLKPGESSAKLELSSPDLGLCVYDLNLKALPPPNERPVYFKTSLGSSHTVVVKFINFCRQKTDYICKVDSPDFKIDKSIPAAPSQTPSGIEVSFEITYEPSNLVDTKVNLLLTSSVGGDYVIPLHGTCLPPKPQGPFQIKTNGSTGISFKNVFSVPLAFSFAIDNPLFIVSKASETIKPHQTYKLNVSFTGNDGPNKADVMGKLVITAPKSAGSSNNIQWIYYLKGVS